MKKFTLFFLAVSLLLICSLAVFAEDAAEMPTDFIEASSEAETTTEAFSEIENATESEEPTELEEATEAETESAIVPEISPRWVNCYVNKSLTVLQNRIMYIDDALYLPAEEITPLLGLECERVVYSETLTAIRLSYGENTGYFFPNSYYAVINDEALNTERPAYLVDDAFYIPLDIFTDLFGVEQNLDTSNPDLDLYLTSFLDKKSLKYAERVSSLESDTDCLIWISKADFSLRLFKKSGSGWIFQKEFTCAIGAPETPTCEGTYKFYERVSQWRYDTYYVGPIMRFNGGYAIHSTLINYDGTPRDNRVGVKISHGCVRLRPDDINYLHKVIPLYTTIYVSAN